MAAIATAAYLENGGLSYTADILRRATKVLRNTPGVLAPGDMAVAQNGTPNMSVNVAAGNVAVDGTQVVATQGTYQGTNDATANLAIAASDPTNPRIDIVVAQFEDSVYAGGANDFKIAVVTGTPAPSPVAPATPANALVLAQVRVNATVTSIVNSNITDFRTFVQQSVFPGVTGVTFFDSTGALQNLLINDQGVVTMRNALNIPPSQNGTLAATSYGTVNVKIGETVLGAPAATVTFSSIPSGFRHLNQTWVGRCDNAAAQPLNFRVHADAGANYNYGGADQSTAAAQTLLGAAAATAARIGVMPGTGSGAGIFGGGTIRIINYGSTTLRRTFHWQGFRDDASLIASESGAGDWMNVANAVDSTTMLPSAGNFIAGSIFTLQGEP